MQRVSPTSLISALVLLAGLGNGTVSHAFGSLIRTFNDPTVTSEDRFGTSVALDGSHVLIGARGDDTNGTDVGQAHLFEASTGSLLQTFNDPMVTSEDWFGTSVALDGNHVLIGAPRHDTNGTNAGQAHLFDTSTGSLLQTFNDPIVTPFDQFGLSVALDGNHVLIGAPWDSTNGRAVGQAHLFDASTGSLLRTFNDPTPTDVDLFGLSVAIDGNNVLIGASGDDTNGTDVGQAHLFDASTGSLLHTFNDPTVTNEDHFGFSVALDGKHVLIGARLDDSNGADVGQAHLFDAYTGSLLQTFNDPTATPGISVALDGNRVPPTVTRDDQFGISVALDGNRVLIGERLDENNGKDAGQAHLFNASTGNLLQTFNDPKATAEDRFGFSLALDGNHVLIGAYNDKTNGIDVGQAHLFEITVPEPSSILLLATPGFIALAGRRRTVR